MVAHSRLQVRHLAFRLEYGQFMVGRQQRTSGAVVSTVFQAVQAAHQDGVSFLLSYISYNSTHINSSILV
jgi:hypothetical protein